MTFGQLSIYYYSYFYQLDKGLDLAKATSLINYGVVFMAICTAISVKIAKKVSYKYLIRICAFLYPLGILGSAFTQNIYIFYFMYLIFSICACALASNII